MAYFTDVFEGKKYFKKIEFDHLEFFTGNAKQSAYFYKNAFGFDIIAYHGPETTKTNRVSYVMKKNKVYFVITSALVKNHYINDWISKHGDGVFNVAFSVNSVKDSLNGCLDRGAELHSEYFCSEDNGFYEEASIKSYGDCIHSFINRSKYNGSWAPGFDSFNENTGNKDSKIILIDHVVANVELDKMDYWKKYYEKIFGFTAFVRFDENDISTKYSSLKSVVVRSENWKVKLPINEPAEGLKKSQIEEYLEFNSGPGVQHIALLSSNIIETISILRENGVEFLQLPSTYYDLLRKKKLTLSENIDKLQELGILVDNDDEGYLLQLFTKPVQDRPTLFIEIIQRKGSRGFGQGNFQSLFESIELEQQKRGNL